MRGYCEFMGCDCQQHIYLNKYDCCRRCGHGACWHVRVSNAFESTRACARKPRYMFIAVGIPTTDDTLPVAYAISCEELPV